MKTPPQHDHHVAPTTGSGGPGAAFFDLDRTLIAGSSALRLARSFRKHGLLSRRQQVRAAIVQLGFMLKGADEDDLERFNATAKELIGGWDRDFVRRIIADELERHVRPTVYEEALERVDLHRRRGERVYVVSATMRDIVEPLAELLGLDGAVATEMEIVDGRYSGYIESVCHGPGKADRLHEFARVNGIDLAKSTAYTDSITDEKFLRSVGRPYAVNPDRDLRRLAEDEGWGILNFRTRVEVPLHHRREVRLGAALAVAAMVGMGMASRRRGD